ncbi:AraC family transcriptional regulator, regulatory protein of adaptative response / methylated-DNA-[protein]-cysteine methyltransferase [Reichenbachiella faecimaris]|uniref:Methylated-DNA--protein-cysteine methyltransferase n=1 Tax=Reichenbachiella faecimaris TaxID=692418 RepID=A0A1W2GEK2_REIFA|nr:methylated-DNA--[protein]-cysteine S-methyltransferase [Reichenbachiella faecimaris]SMD34944.1 AraC family transcriptional regulator, regulatory protein of adaptative response / methylated-DNA-[protein]-cysteine methyltransferase [Reichenbachiella faecimaris]
MNMQLSLLPDIDTMYDALVRKDSSFEGVFFAAIKTTGIFCRPTCHARKPKAENVEYFGNSKEALDHGYRPCKVCHPMEMKGVVPSWLKSLLDDIEATPNIRINDQNLRERGLDPTRVRRWFKKNHGITFQAYLRSLRINNAFGQIRQGDQVIQSAYSNGFESLSGFLDSFKNSTGFSPKESNHKNVISVTRIPTPLGPMIAGATDNGICLLEFTDRRMIETQVERLRKYLKAELIPGQSPFFETLTLELNQYFEGKLQQFTVPLETPGTEFQQKVWKVLQDIPYGKTRSYKEQAIAINNLKAIRAVATANGDNRIAIIIPCHRVIGSDGSMTGYGGGVWRKQKLLELERKNC